MLGGRFSSLTHADCSDQSAEIEIAKEPQTATAEEAIFSGGKRRRAVDDSEPEILRDDLAFMQQAQVLGSGQAELRQCRERIFMLVNCSDRDLIKERESIAEVDLALPVVDVTAGRLAGVSFPAASPPVIVSERAGIVARSDLLQNNRVADVVVFTNGDKEIRLCDCDRNVESV